MNILKNLAIFLIFVGFSGSSFGNQVFRETVETADEPEVFQREYIVTESLEYSFIQTTGVYTCVALIAWEPDLKIGLLAHLDPATNIDRELERLKNDINWRTSEITLIGGLSDSPRLFNEIEGKIIQLGGSIKTRFQNTRGSAGMNLRLNLEDGEVSTFRPRYISTDPQVARAKISRIRSGSRLFRHEDSIGGGDPVELESTNQDPFNIFSFH